MEKRVKSLEEFNAEARDLVLRLAPQDDKATLITLSGELGAGKTAFTKAAAAALGIEEVVNSPTFVLEKIYLLPEGAPFKRLIHIDAYRLEGGKELAPLGFDELMKDAGNLVFLEWPQKVARALPQPAHAISIRLENGARVISYA
ncbi:MAG TPA: tRNA (adenosine(37)-N6)-threonylcarbamoyltransferase complex ATPase subunit type 1 TsaE [Candidatus Paceibacterota bacterium]|nr:tRNA (adenosine(37)-N6)-threonylcarbamoyltransferase complex ATPase subunit type 1 TsaE [Candidatus Paceibacterota bacterium]